MVELILSAVGSDCCTSAANEGPEIKANLALNISPENFYSEHFTDDLLTLLKESSLPLNRIILEINESSLELNYEYALKRIQELAQHGIRFAIDNYGMGSTQLSYLSQLPITLLKLAPSLNEKGKQPNDAAGPGETSFMWLEAREKVCCCCGKWGHLSPECLKCNALPPKEWHVWKAMQSAY